MDKTTNALNWFEIPATDISRAKKFYETVFAFDMEEGVMGDNKMAFFPYENGSSKVAGALTQSPSHTPAKEGTVVYLNANPAMDEMLARVKGAGGQVAVEKMAIGKEGYIAFIIDTEGNQVGMHSEN